MKKIFMMSLSVVILNAGLKVPVAFEANFRQKITDANKKVIEYRGKLKSNSSGELKWSYTSPTQKEVCGSDGNFVMVDHDLEQVTTHSIDESLNLGEVLRNAVAVKATGVNSADYKNKLYETTYQGKHYTIGLDSKKHIDQIAYIDNMENRVNIHFTHMRYLSKAFKTKAMECKYPKGYDVVSQ